MAIYQIDEEIKWNEKTSFIIKKGRDFEFEEGGLKFFIFNNSKKDKEVNIRIK